MKIKFFEVYDVWELEDEVNKFILDKDVINISYSVAQCGYEYKRCCCVLYRE